MFKEKGYRVITFWRMARWMGEETSFAADIAAVLGLDIYDPSAKYVRTRENTGTCPCCFRNVKLDNDGRMVRTVKVTVTVKFGDAAKGFEVPSFTDLINSKIDQTERELRAVNSDVAFYNGKVQGWKLAPLPEAGQKVRDGK